MVRKLNELFKASVASCRALSARLQRFFSRKQLLMDRVSPVSAERLLFSHAVQMVSAHGRHGRHALTPRCVQVQAAALDEMFQQGEAAAPRYHKALLLMEGLTLLLTERRDISSVRRCEGTSKQHQSLAVAANTVSLPVGR